MKMPRFVAICILAVGLGTVAHADTVYTFTGTDSNGAVGFQLITPTFISQIPSTFTAGQFSSCTNCGLGFTAMFTPGILVVPSTLTIFDWNSWGSFTFAANALNTPGTYTSLTGKGTLVVSVPEPATLFMGFLTLAMILGLIAFRRNSQLQLSRG